MFSKKEKQLVNSAGKIPFPKHLNIPLNIQLGTEKLKFALKTRK